jgi:hypothetical protein
VVPSLSEQNGTAPKWRWFQGGSIAAPKMSGYGANLEVESQIGIPNSFDLVIDTEHSNHHCHVVWRKARRIGIAFD